MTDRPPGSSGDGVPQRTYGRRRRRYFLLMAVCVALFVCAWGFVRLVSVPLAVAMCVVAALIPPVAAVVANRRGPGDPWWDEPQR